jgi:hypothetical protein
MTPSVSGDFAYTSANNALDMIQFNNGANWSDQSANITPRSTAGVNLLNIGGINYGAVGAVWYFGKSETFDTLSLHFAGNTDNTVARTVTWEYWNGSTWTTLAQSGSTQEIAVVTGQIDIENNTHYNFKINPNIYSTWATTSVNGSSSLYYIRATITVSALTTANLQSVSIYDHVTRVGNTRFDIVYTTTNDVAFTDVTRAIRSNSSGAVTFTANTTNARLYMGSNSNNINSILYSLSTAGAGGDCAWEYWNGSTWASIPFITSGPLSSFYSAKESLLAGNATTNILFSDALANWTTTTVNGVSMYWLRIRVTSTYSTNPIFQILLPLKTTQISRTVWIPESTNRTIQSAFIKLHLYNPTNSAISRIYARGRFGTDSFSRLEVGDSTTPQGTFSSIGGKVFSTTANDAVFTDVTNDASDSGSNDVSITNSVNANIYFCYPNDAVWTKRENYLLITPQATHSGGLVEWEYWNGSAWTSFEPICYSVDKHLNFGSSANSRQIIIPVLSNWTANTVNGFTGYNIRRRITQTYSSTSSWTSVAISYPGFNSTTYTNTSENNATSVFIDATTLFQDTFTGSSQTFDFEIGYSTISAFLGDLAVTSGELFITYGSDTQNTRIKSVIIPLTTIDNTGLSNSLNSIGSNELPDLASYLPEASKVMRNFYIVVTGNDQCSTPMTYELRMKVGSAAERYSIGITSGQVTGNTVKLIYTDDAISTGSAQDIQMAISARHLNFRNWSMYAVATYEYDASTTTRTINTLMLPFETSSTTLPQDDPNYPEKIRKKFFIEEPGTINNVRVGAYIYFNDVSSPVMNIKDMSESTYKTVSFIDNQRAGGFRYGYRLPTGTLIRGRNEIGIDIYGSATGAITPSCWYTCGYFIVNYHSDVFSGGIEKHNKVISCIHQFQKVNAFRNISMNRLVNPLSEWFMNDFGLMGEFYFATVANTTLSVDTRFILENPNNTEETKAVFGAGGLTYEASDSMFYDVIVGDRDKVKKYLGDAHEHRTVDLFNGGRFITEYGYSTVIGGSQTITSCHEISYTVTGSVIGYSGNGSGLAVTFYDDETGEKLFEATTAVGGTFSAVWYDNTRPIVCDVYDPTLDRYEESSPGIAGTDIFTMDFTGGSGGGTTSHAFIG